MIPTPYLLILLYDIDPYLPFALMGSLSTLILMVDCFFSKDKTQKHLEELKSE